LKGIKLSLIFGGILLFIMVIVFTVSKNQLNEKPVFKENFNGFKLSLYKPTMTRDDDTKKIIINLPVKIHNTSDHGFVFSDLDLFYNDNKLLSSGGLIKTGYIVDTDLVIRKYSMNDDKIGTLKIHFNTRDKSEIFSINPVFVIKDMSTDEKMKIQSLIKINSD
jgi:hypothetical protein